MKAAELREKLADGLRGDTSGKTTPIQRLTPFLNDLVSYLEQEEVRLPVVSFFGEEDIAPAGKHLGTMTIDHIDAQKDSSNSATQAVPASTKSETGDATKATS